MSHRFIGVEEADLNGYIAGVRMSQSTLLQEAKRFPHPIQHFAERLSEVLQELIYQAKPELKPKPYKPENPTDEHYY